MATISSGKNLEWPLAILVVSPRGYCDSDESNIRLDCVAYFEWLALRAVFDGN